MTAWHISAEEARIYVAGVGLGNSLGRRLDGIYLVDFPDHDCIVGCLPWTVFELRDGDHRPVCAFALEMGRA